MEPIISLTERLKQIVPGLQVPGAAATKTVLNAPKGAAKRIPVVGPMIDMGLATYDVTQGVDPVRAYTRMATEMAGGALGAGAAGMLALPTGPGAAAAGFAGYMGGSAAAGAGYDALFPEGIRVGSLDGKRSIGNINDTSYDLSTPEGAAGFDKARKAALKVQTDKGVVPGQLPSDYKETEAEAFRGAAEAGDPQTPQIRQMTAATGTDTGSGDREALREAGGDPAMVAWAKANPELAKRMVATQDRRLETNPDFKQSGYEAVRGHLYPERAVLAAEGDKGVFSARDAATMGMTPQNAINIASGGSVETLIDADGTTEVSSAPGKAQDLLTSYKQGLTNPSVEEAPTDKAPANMIGLDYDQVNSKMSELGGEEYLKQLDAGKFTRR